MLMRSHLPPVEALTKTLMSAVNELSTTTPAPADLTMTAALVIASSTVQCNADVMSREGMIQPTGLFGNIIAASGTGKTLATTKLSRGIAEFDDIQARRHCVRLEEYKSLADAHEAQRTRILKKLKKASSSDAEKITMELVSHDAAKPPKPKWPRVLNRDITPSGLTDALAGWSNLLIVNDEAAHFFDNRLPDMLSVLNSTFSGSPIVKKTATEQKIIGDPRVALLTAFQPNVFLKANNRLGSRLTTEGFYPRCLMCCSESSPPVNSWRWQTVGGVDDFNKRCQELLESSVTAEGEPVARRLLTFDSHAQQIFDQQTQAISQERAPGFWLQNLPELASKIPENIARVAAVLHVFEDFPGNQISADTLERAITLVRWYACEQHRLFTENPPVPQEILDGQNLLRWLANFVRTHGTLQIPRSTVLRCGPRGTRHAVRLTAALAQLWNQGFLFETSGDKKNPSMLILNGNIFTQQNIASLCAGSPGF